MEYLILLAALGAFLVFIFVREALNARKIRKKFIQSIYEGYGQPSQKEYAPERYARINGYYNRHKEPGQIDDITWNDLNMDDIFRKIDHSLSATGEEYLYFTLRNLRREPSELQHAEEMISWFDSHPDERVQVQLLLHKLGHTGKFSLYEYIDHLDYLGERSNRRHHLVNMLYLPFLLLTPFQLSFGLLGLAAVAVYQIVSYFKEKNENEPYIISFSYVIRLIEVCKGLSLCPVPVCKGEFDGMQEHIKKLHGVKGGSYWVFSAGQGKLTGSPLDAVFDYLRMIFHIDLIIFNKMLAGLRQNVEDIDALITLAGSIEASISVASFRASLANGWCRPELTGSGEGQEIRMKEGYHPLLEEPVKNSVTVRRGILLTGSNASGKSTFLKTVALNMILAQTIHTCAAESFRAPFSRVYSSMALRDDLAGGESYYIVEIKALKRILDAVNAGGEYPVVCFVDEVLRGTNTVERIAASVQILKSLTGSGVICFAATHDIELTELLKKDYDNYHFEEEVKDGDIFFQYKLLSGKAATRNAIKLLDIMGYEQEITMRAEEMAQRFVETGLWQA